MVGTNSQYVYTQHNGYSRTRHIKIINTFFTALTILAAASCAKELQPESQGERVLTASFAAAGTKSTLDGRTPKWAENDVVKFTDGTNFQDFTLVTGTPGANLESNLL